MTPAELRDALYSPGFGDLGPFGFVQAVSRMLGGESDSVARDLLIRALEHRDRFGSCQVVLDSLVRQAGLFPYVEPRNLSVRDLLAYEYHRPLGGDLDGIVFHRVQADVYRELLAGRNVILSAPTSFGKSLIIDALIAAGRYRNIVIVVPTIALIDGTRRRLAARFADRYKLITHPSQPISADRNIFVLTPERVTDRADLEYIDLFVIDEFYELDARRGEDDGRVGVLNHALYMLLKRSNQFYLLGPNIRGVPVGFSEKFQATVFVTDCATVATDVRRVDISRGREEALVALVRELDEPAIVYCRSPQSVRDVVGLLLEANVMAVQRDLHDAVEWLAEHYHRDRIFARGLRCGIGVHHGRIPRALGQFVVRLFDEGKLRLLVCTSTLIEGVNTTAKHVIIYDHQIARRNLDYFTLNNIKGRSGCMFRHFVGVVHLFGEAPQPELLDVDFPFYTQDEGTSTSLLVQLDAADLLEGSAVWLSVFEEQDYLSMEIIRRNKHIGPGDQVALARHLSDNIEELDESLSWRGEPSWKELRITCELLFWFFGRNLGRGTVRSGGQLAYLVNAFRRSGSVGNFLRAETANLNAGEEPDAKIEDCLDVLRNWASFHFPRLLRAFYRIQAEVYSRHGRVPGDYRVFGARIESLLTFAEIVALDEYGLPLPIAEKLTAHLHPQDGLDAVLARLRQLEVRSMPLSAFEQDFMAAVQ